MSVGAAETVMPLKIRACDLRRASENRAEGRA
jgi:hypothetical protein